MLTLKDFYPSKLSRSELINLIVSSRTAYDLDSRRILWSSVIGAFPYDTYLNLIVIHSTWDAKDYSLSFKYSKSLYHNCGHQEPLLYLTLYDSALLHGSILMPCNDASATGYAQNTLLLFLTRYVEYDRFRLLPQISSVDYILYKQLFRELLELIPCLPTSLLNTLNDKTDYSCISLQRIMSLVALSNYATKPSQRQSSLFSKSITSSDYYVSRHSLRRFLVCSMPKAGTHLFAKILENIGIFSSSWFIEYSRVIIEIDKTFGSNRVQDYSYLRDTMKPIYNYIQIDLTDSLALIPHNRFALTHILPNNIPKDWLEDNLAFLLIRDPWDCIVSAFKAELKLAQYPLYARDPEVDFILSNNANSSFDELFSIWLEYYIPSLLNLYIDALSVSIANPDNVTLIHYERLLSAAPDAYLHEKLDSSGIEVTSDLKNVIGKSLSSHTPTRNTERDTYSSFLTDRNRISSLRDLYSRSKISEVYSEIKSLSI